MRRFGFSGRNLSGRGAHCVQMELFGIAQAAILAHAAAPTVGVGGINPWRLWGALPRRAFVRKISKLKTKSPRPGFRSEALREGGSKLWDLQARTVRGARAHFRKIQKLFFRTGGRGQD